jgi:transforming growth factor-beta-induced protein
MKLISQKFKEIQRLAVIVLLLAMPFVIASCSDDDDDDKRSNTITEIASRTSNLSTLYSALEASGLDAALDGTGPFTVFAPSNDAFAKLDPATLNTIISTPSLLTSLLQYHVVSGEVFSGDLSNGPVQTLLSGQSVDVSLAGGGVTLNGSSNVTDADIDASNGVIHIIDEVLIPEDFFAQTIVQIAAANPDTFSTLVAALSKPELSDLLAAANDPTSDLTVFAPTNDAFDATLAALGKESIDDIPVELLREIVTYHILGTAVFSNQLTDGAEVATLLPDETVTVDLTDGVKINGASVIEADIQAVNGVIHAVNGVLLPSYVEFSLGTVAEVVLFENDVTVLAAALRQADLLETVATADDITVFAPDNAAFVAAGITSLDGLTAEDLAPILTYHVLGARVLSTQLPESGIAQTLNDGANIYLGYLFGGRVLINGLTEIKAVDIEKSNGVIHVIDRTLVPPAPNVVEIAVALADADEGADFTVLTSLLASDEYSDIADAIIAQDNITVFAPTDAAFEAISDIIATLTPEQIADVLTYHAALGRNFSYDLVQGQNITMLNTQTVNVTTISGETIVLQDKSMDATNVLQVNIHGSNGVIHAIDKVLIPNL